MKINPERTRRYLRRTMTEPAVSYVLTPAEAAWHEEWMYAWRRNSEDDTPEPPVVEWRRQVAAYCKAKGLKRLRITVDGISLDEGDGRAPLSNQTHTLRWTAEGER